MYVCTKIEDNEFSAMGVLWTRHQWSGSGNMLHVSESKSCQTWLPWLELQSCQDSRCNNWLSFCCCLSVRLFCCVVTNRTRNFHFCEFLKEFGPHHYLRSCNFPEIFIPYCWFITWTQREPTSIGNCQKAVVTLPFGRGSCLMSPQISRPGNATVTIWTMRLIWTKVAEIEGQAFSVAAYSNIYSMSSSRLKHTAICAALCAQTLLILEAPYHILITMRRSVNAD